MLIAVGRGLARHGVGLGVVRGMAD